jgi:hypothetical protein
MSSSLAPEVPRRRPVPAKACKLIRNSVSARRLQTSLKYLVMSVNSFDCKRISHFKMLAAYGCKLTVYKPKHLDRLPAFLQVY